MKVALDAMGGDHAPHATVAGAVLALREFPKLEKLFLVGDEARIRAELEKNGCRDPRVEILHATQVVEMSESAVDGVRRKKDSSISRAVDLVKHGQADAVVSAGHTLEGVDRPGIAALLPTETNLCVLIDAGANTDARPEHMLQYAIMGAVFSRYVLGYDNPAIGLMSIGGEDVKGSEFTKDIFKLLKASGLNFRGNIEGHDLFQNPVEVVLCDGFTGNVVLKSCEATAEAVFHWLKNEIKRSPVRLAGAYLMQGAFRNLKKRTNYEEYGGSPLLGVDGICIIAHGSSSPKAIKNAIRVALESIQTRINPHIVEELAAFYARE
jgi:glycerol-3-phosphate acyltransferase PlsX